MGQGTQTEHMSLSKYSFFSLCRSVWPATLAVCVCVLSGIHAQPCHWLDLGTPVRLRPEGATWVLKSISCGILWQHKLQKNKRNRKKWKALLMLEYLFLRKRNLTEGTAWFQGSLHISQCFRAAKLFNRLLTADISAETWTQCISSWPHFAFFPGAKALWSCLKCLVENLLCSWFYYLCYTLKICIHQTESALFITEISRTAYHRSILVVFNSYSQEKRMPPLKSLPWKKTSAQRHNNSDKHHFPPWGNN